MTRYKKELFITVLIFITFGFLVYLETQLPFFRRFLPIGENKLIILILNINLLLILLLIFLIARTVFKGYIEKKRGIWGAGLKKKLTVTLLFISVVPSFTLFFLAIGFFHISLDKWFGQKIEGTIEDALVLSQFYYDDLFERYEKTATILARDIEKKQLLKDTNKLDSFLNQNVRSRPLSYVGVYDMKGSVLNSAGPTAKSFGGRPFQKSISIKGDTPLRYIVPFKAGELVVAGKRITGDEGIPVAVLFVGNLVKVQGMEKIRRIASANKEFKESRAYKKLLKYSYYIPLFLVTMITIFASVWVGIKMATQISVPIEQVKEGAAIIAKGNFNINLEDRGEDEIGTLVRGFNAMAAQLQVAKDEIEDKKRYMEVILDNVATGIISTDTKGQVLLLNRAGRNILGIEQQDVTQLTLKDIFGDEFKKHMRLFLKEVRMSAAATTTREMRLNIKKDVTYLRASLTVLKAETGRPEGFIITFDDITHIVRAEKLSTWREIAKKLTHEIKNPLTPIILSAERLRRKLLTQVHRKDKELIDETTTVIIQSVQDIKSIVNELTKLTHLSQTKTIEDINTIVEETVSTYKNLYPHIAVTQQGHPVPPFRLEKDGIRRALTNLIANSVRAIGNEEGAVSIETTFDNDKGACIVTVTDTGTGIPDEDKGKVFDPYFTKNEDGMGLGLAIVHSIILEHHGKIFVEDNHPRGTRFVIELPVLEA